MGETMTSEQRAAIAVHYAEHNRICLDPRSDGSICLACAEVADQIDAAVEVERQRGIEALAAANARADAAEAKLRWYQTTDFAESLAAARRECEGLRKALNEIVGATDDNIAEKIARAALASPAAGEEGT